jgi:hypothetical protein
VSTPRKVTDPTGDKRRALAHAAAAQRRLDEVMRARSAAFRFAHDTGSSLREIAEATGVPHMTVKRLIEVERPPGR